MVKRHAGNLVNLLVEIHVQYVQVLAEACHSHIQLF